MNSIFKSFMAGVLLLFATQVVPNDNNPEMASSAEKTAKYDVLGGAYVTFAGKFGGEVTREDLRAYSSIGIAGCAAGSRILQFKLHVKANGKETIFDGQSQILTDDMLKSLRALTKGDTFFFTDMRAKLPAGGKVDVIGRIFTVV